VKGLGGLGGLQGVFDGGAAGAYARSYNDAALTVLQSFWTSLLQNSERWDVGNLHDVSVNTSRMTAPFDGIYFITAHGKWELHNSSTRYLAIDLNGGAGNFIGIEHEPICSLVGQTQSVGTIWELSAGDYVTADVYQAATPADLDVVAALNESPEFTMHLLGRNAGRVGARVHNSVAISVANNTYWVTLTFDSERFDYGDFHSTVANTERLVAPSAGKYLVTFNGYWASSTVGFRIFRMVQNQSTVETGLSLVGRDPIGADMMHCSGITNLDADDYVYMTAFQNRGSALNVNASADYSPEFAIHKLGDEGCKAYNNADISIPSGAWTTLDLNSEEWDSNGLHDPGSNPSRITIKQAGYYAIVATHRFTGQVSGSRGVRVSVNGTPVASQDYDSDTNTPSCSVETVYYLNVDDYVEMEVFQNVGVPQNIVYTAGWSPYLAVQELASA
jgi:hypothetical protein